MFVEGELQSTERDIKKKKEAREGKRRNVLERDGTDPSSPTKNKERLGGN